MVIKDVAKPLICPQCCSAEGIKTERRPNGYSECSICGLKKLTSKFRIKAGTVAVAQESRKRAQNKLEEIVKGLVPYSFGAFAVRILTTDKCSFFLNPGFKRDWQDPDSGHKWIFVFSKTYPALLFRTTDLIHCEEWAR